MPESLMSFSTPTLTCGVYILPGNIRLLLPVVVVVAAVVLVACSCSMLFQFQLT
jgi:hypothetical protein